MSETTTTLKLSKKTKERLDKLKEYRRETYNEVLNKILNILNICKASPERARSNLISIEKQKRRLKGESTSSPSKSSSR